MDHLENKALIRVAVTGGFGQIAYNLLFRLASGEVFGKDQPIALHILEVPSALNALQGVKMELQDCAYPTLKDIHIGSDPSEIFEGVHYALLIGAKPRGPGIERQDLLKDNGKIFIEQGQALNKVASPNVKVIVVGNPCNTNCLIAMKNAPRLPKTNFFAMMMLDQNRAALQLKQKANVEISDVSNVIVWGNHSATQVPDFTNAKIKGQPVKEMILDEAWLKNDFMSIVQKRGAAIIEARGKSSAASAANAVIDLLKALLEPTPAGKWFSCGVLSDGNHYGIEKGLIFSFPCRMLSSGICEIVNGLTWDAFLAEKIKASERELIEERNLIGGL